MTITGSGLATSDVAAVSTTVLAVMLASLGWTPGRSFAVAEGMTDWIVSGVAVMVLLVRG